MFALPPVLIGALPPVRLVPAVCECFRVVDAWVLDRWPDGCGVGSQDGKPKWNAVPFPMPFFIPLGLPIHVDFLVVALICPFTHTSTFVVAVAVVGVAVGISPRVHDLI